MLSLGHARRPGRSSPVAMVIQRYLLSFAAVRIDAATLDFLTRRLLELPMSYFMTRRTGDIQRRLEGIRQVREFFVQSGVSGAHGRHAAHRRLLALMFIYSPCAGARLPRDGAAATCADAVLVARLPPDVRRASRKPTGEYHSYQIDAIKGIETVKAMGGEHAFRRSMLGAVPRRSRASSSARTSRS